MLKSVVFVVLAIVISAEFVTKVDAVAGESIFCSSVPTDYAGGNDCSDSSIENTEDCQIKSMVLYFIFYHINFFN